MAKVKLENVRLSFPEIFQPGKFDETSRPTYRAQFLFPKDSPLHKTLLKAVEETAKEKWTEKKFQPILKQIQSQSNKYCLSDGDTKTYDGYAGMIALSASRDAEKGKPLVLDRNKSPLSPEDGKPYAGCFVNATVEIWCQDNKFGKAVRAQLLAVQFAKDGDAFAAGGVANPDDFDELADQGEESLV
jgi:hypothetical protein